jgi:FKBP-type peptidyl-prolyl cis-trans isomerase SlyD
MNPRIISFHYTLTDPQGQTIDSSAGREPLSFLEGAGQIIPGLESELGTLTVGEKKRVHVKAEHAYGVRNDELLFEVPRDKMPVAEVRVGDKFRSAQSPVPLTVAKVTDSHVTLDANHPLAGQDLTFDVELTATREATAEDLERGHSCCGNHDKGCCEGH